MTRGVRVALVSSFAFTGLICVIYLSLRPSWVTASHAEIDRVIDPALLTKEARDPLAEERSERLHRILESLPPRPMLSSVLENSTSERISAAARAYRSAARKELPRINSILTEGPIRQPPATKPFSSHPNFSGEIAFARGLALLIADPSASTTARLSAIQIGTMFVSRILECSRSFAEVFHGYILASTIEGQARSFLNTTPLSMTEAKGLLQSLPDLEVETRLDQVIVGDFQSNVHPWLPDPRPYIKFFRDEGILPSFADEEAEDEFGSYNAADAAKEFSALYTEALHSQDLPNSEVSNPVHQQMSNIFDSLPEVDYEKQSGLQRWWSRQVFHYKFDHIPNSFAHCLFPVGPGKYIRDGRDRTRAWHRLLRLQVACDLYAGKAGHFPTALSDLVSAGILESIPNDPLGDCEMHYDPVRKIIWSVGEDHIDDGGTKRRPGRTDGDDVVHLLAAKPWEQ